MTSAVIGDDAENPSRANVFSGTPSGGKRTDAVDVSGLNMIAARLSPGAISESPAMNSRRRRQMLIWPSLASQWTKPEGAGQQAIRDRGGPRITSRRHRGGPRKPIRAF
jgi:hypothetical protein